MGISSITMTGGGTNPGIGRWALLSGRGAGGKEVDNEDDCAIIVELGEFLNRVERVAKSLQEGSAFITSLVDKDGMAGDSGWSNSAILPPREFKLTERR